MKTRAIEMFIGVGSDNGTWCTEYVYIPFDTPDNEIVEVSIKTLKNGELSDDFQFCGVYSIPSLCSEINVNFYYEIHVMGKNGFSTCLITDTEYDTEDDWDDILNEAIKDNKIDKDDINYVDYIEELDEDEAQNYYHQFYIHD